MLLPSITSSDDPDSSPGKTALVTGSLALGALLTTRVFKKVRRHHLPPSNQRAGIIEAPVREMKLMEGHSRFYFRAGEGTPVVLLHSFNAAASSAEMHPVFAHLAHTTGRPIYALDWFGFGLSDRPPIRYRPDIYLRQLRRLLSELVGTEADLIALSLGGEYAAAVAAAFPMLIRRLVLIAPTSLSDRPGPSLLRRTLISTADQVGVFELFFYRITRPASLRRFYEEQVFLRGASVPDALVEQAYRTAHVAGAHYAPRYFVGGSLFLKSAARRAYEELRVPTLLILPSTPEQTIQSFERLPDVLAANPDHLRTETLDAGLMPYWERPDLFFPLLDAFLA